MDEIRKGQEGQAESGTIKDADGVREHRPLRVRLGIPDPGYRERPSRRIFTAEFKRRYGLFHTQVRLWKEQIERGELEALSPKKRGPKPQDPDARVRELAAKDREIQRLREQLAKAETIIEVQKKISEILKIPLNPPTNDEND